MSAVFAAACGFDGAAAQERLAQGAPCSGEEIARGAVSHIIDGRTFVLDDGREVRLAAIEVPPPEPADDDGTAARDALGALLEGGGVVVSRAQPQKTDRYGRLFAFARVTRDGVERLAEAELVAGGFARVAGAVGSHGRASALLDLEGAARKAKLGLWGNSYYDVLDADRPDDVLAQWGRFALVEGEVVSVRESGARIYVNFGRRWTEDFTVTIRKRNERTFTAAGLEPKQLAGRRIRVRGWIEERGGPWIEAAHPEQIEIIE